MKPRTYYASNGGLPPQTELMTGRAVFTEAYAVIPKGSWATSWRASFRIGRETRGWIIARPMTGFAETFSQYIMEVSPGGGSDRPEPDSAAQAALFVVAGNITLTIGSARHELAPGGYAYIPPGTAWTVRNHGGENARFHWIRKRHQRVEGLALPDPVVTSDSEVAPSPMPDTEGRWATTRFVDPNDVRHDMHVTIVTFEPGGLIPFEETHVMEHGSTCSRARRSTS